MGAFTSRLEDINKSPSANESKHLESQNCTPKNSKILPFDPRSPSENFNRTPIAVCDENGTPITKGIRNLTEDPRSPMTEVTRTPILVESNSGDRPKHRPMRPSNLVEISCRNNANNKSDENASVALNKDPRSPSESVPRTPLDEDHSTNKSESDNLNAEIGPKIATQKQPENSKDQSRVNLISKRQDEAPQGRKPLLDVQNQPVTSAVVPKIVPEDIENEFTQNENFILKRLSVGSQKISSKTEFTDEI